MKHPCRYFPGVSIILSTAMAVLLTASVAAPQEDNPNPPREAVKLIFGNSGF
jgi:hypothetical protein